MNPICPICNSNDARVVKIGHLENERYREIICKNCGAVDVSEKVSEYLLNNKSESLRVAQLLNEQHLKDLFFFQKKSNGSMSKNEYLQSKKIILVEDGKSGEMRSTYLVKTVEQLLKTYPQSVLEKLNRALCNIAHWQLLSSSGYFHPCRNMLFAENSDEFSCYSDLLVDNGWCKRIKMDTRVYLHFELTLTIKGLERVEELEKNWQNSTSAFIAMWFDNETQNYRTVVEEAIRKAGYDPKIIDSYEHNNFIMDEVINQINEAKFVIADFTCVPERPERNSKIPGGVRGGVYFEAGYAKGLGKEVIVTCKDSDEAKKRRHFDIDQLNTLFWREGEDGKLYDANNIDFVYRLTERIKATVGKGTL